MIPRTSTMPQRDVSYGPTSLEANKIDSSDMRWLAEAIAARGGTAPFDYIRVLYASQMQSVYSAFSGLTSTHWVAHDLSPEANWNVGSSWDVSSIGAAAPLPQRACRSTVATGSPLYGYDMRTAFWNSMQCERAIFEGRLADVISANMTYRTIGQGGITPGNGYVMSRNYRSSQTGDGFDVTGGTFTLPFAAVNPGFPQTIDDWECDQAYAVVIVRSYEQISSGAYAVWAAVPIDADATSDGVEVNAVDVLTAGQSVATHYGISTSGYPIASIALSGLVPVMAVGDNYRISDLGWTFQP